MKRITAYPITLVTYTIFTLLLVDSAFGDSKRILMVTYNVQQKGPNEVDLRKLLSLDSDPQPDLIALGLQEVSSSFFSNPTSKWEKKVFEVLDRERYRKVSSERLQGMILMLYVKEGAADVRSAETSYIKTGFNGLWGNKGAVGIATYINGKSVVFVNSHLPPHEGNFEHRVSNYHDIMNGMKFRRVAGNIADHDYIFWMGDLNFRVLQFTPQDILSRIQRVNQFPEGVREVLAHDELMMVRSERRAFVDFRESVPSFMPTYKFYENSNEYNLKRKPAWTDRILYRVKSDDGNLDARQEDYKGHFDLRISDHRPVSSVIIMNT